jgi:hypothetical protein
VRPHVGLPAVDPCQSVYPRAVDATDPTTREWSRGTRCTVNEKIKKVYNKKSDSKFEIIKKHLEIKFWKKLKKIKTIV